MATSLKEFSTTAASNTAVGSANVDEGCPPSGINNAIRQFLAYVVDWFMSTDTIASAATTDIGTKTASYLAVSGTTTITALGTPTNKTEYTLKFDGALTLTHNATSLILPGGANITTAAGDVGKFRHEGSGNWRCVSYTRANGTPVVGLQASDITGKTALTAPDHAADYALLYDASATALKKALLKYLSPIVARYYDSYTSNTNITTVLPADDTVPTSSEGDEICSVSVTTTNATQRVRLHFDGQASFGSTTITICVAAFRDTTNIAAKAIRTQGDSGTNNGLIPISLLTEDAPGAAATYTYSVRVGPGAAGTIRMNGTVSGRYFGGNSAAVLIAEVIEP